MTVPADSRRWALAAIAASAEVSLAGAHGQFAWRQWSEPMAAVVRNFQQVGQRLPERWSTITGVRTPALG